MEGQPGDNSQLCLSGIEGSGDAVMEPNNAVEETNSEDVSHFPILQAYMD